MGGKFKRYLNECPSAILPFSNFLSIISESLKLSFHNIYLVHVGKEYFMYVLQVNTVACLFSYQNQIQSILKVTILNKLQSGY